ncbi:hypothetical protein, partial [Mesorhizobium sp.]|uniref:hypothetical protein n=1 Tax=Mesorhizobium sp. TaxID=1871066 RepID=UPI0025BB7EDB
MTTSSRHDLAIASERLPETTLGNAPVDTTNNSCGNGTCNRFETTGQYLCRDAPETKKGGPSDRPFPSHRQCRIDYSLMVTTMPAPTVRPPSRMA